MLEVSGISSAHRSVAVSLVNDSCKGNTPWGVDLQIQLRSADGSWDPVKDYGYWCTLLSAVSIGMGTGIVRSLPLWYQDAQLLDTHARTPSTRTKGERDRQQSPHCHRLATDEDVVCGLIGWGGSRVDPPLSLSESRGPLGLIIHDGDGSGGVGDGRPTMRPSVSRVLN